MVEEAHVFVPVPPQPHAAPGSATILLAGFLRKPSSPACWQAPLCALQADSRAPAGQISTYKKGQCQIQICG